MTYEVDYIINVVNPSGVQAMKDMAAAVNLLGPGVKTLDRLNKRITALNKTLNNRKWKMTFDTSQPEAKLTALENRVAALRRSLATVGGGAGGRGLAARTSSSSSRQFFKNGGNMYARGPMPDAKMLGNGMKWAKSVIPIQALSNSELEMYNRLLQKQKQQQRLYRKQLQQKFNKTWGAGQRASFKEMDHAWRKYYMSDPAFKDGKNLPTAERKLYRTTNQLSKTQSQLYRLTNGYVATNATLGTPVNMGKSGRGSGGVPRYRATPNNLGYKLLGPTPFTSNGGMAVDMLKGMGVAYGIAGIGQFFSNIVNDSAEYDNTMQTVENILKSHDKRNNFSNRFTQMSNTIRQVGIQTKFKVTEVADAAKFLAMAGLSVEDINSAIKPISNIALVGDTELGETADLVTNIMTAYNMQSHQMRKASDIMTNTFTMTNTTLPEIAEAYKYSASLLSAGGIGFEEATAAVGVLGDAGIKGSQAGTTMRTILNNIINPRGKYRKQAWEDTGIQKFDKNGQVRSLAEIFTELAAQDLPVDQYYRLFDKTAAQGAVALASHVEKWNEVVEENFMSQSMAEKLADKKKNTIKGLWAQLTSSVTDDGVTAFKGIEGDIKNILRNITNWLQQTHTQELMSGLFDSFKDFVDIILDVTKYFYKFYSMFGFAIKWLIQFQLYMWPVIKTVTTLKTAFMGLMAVTRLASGIRTLSAAFLGLKAVVGGKAAWLTLLADLGGHLMSGGTKPLLPWTSGNVIAGPDNVSYTTSSANGSQMYYTQGGKPLVNPANASTKPPRKGFRFSKFGRGATAAGLTMAGAGLGYAIGNAVNEEHGGLWGTIVGTAAGAGLSAWSLSGFAGAAALLTNPVGWGIAAGAALAAVGVYCYDIISSIDKANKATREWKESLDNLHVFDIDLTKDDGLLIANMRAFNNELLTEQERVGQSIELFNHYWAAKLGPNSIKDEGPVAGMPGGKDLDNLLKIADWNTGKYSAMEERFQAMGGIIKRKPMRRYNKDWILGGEIFASSDFDALNEEEAVRVALAAFGASSMVPIEQAERDILEAVLSTPNSAYIPDRLNNIRKIYLPETSDEYNTDLDADYIRENWQMSDYLQSKWVQLTFKEQIEKAIARFQPFINAKAKFDAGNPLGGEAMQDVLKPMLGLLFDRKFFGMVGSPMWYGRIKDLQTNYALYKDKDGNPLTQEAAEHYVSETFNELVKLYNKLPDKYKPMLSGFLDRSIWSGALSPNESLMSGGYFPGSKIGAKAKDSRGVEYTWSQLKAPYAIGAYGWIDENGRQYLPDAVNGNLDLLSPNGNPFSGSDQYLSQITFASKFASKYPVTNTPLFTPLNKPLAWNPLNTSAPSDNPFLAYTPNSAYQASSATPNVDQSGYRPINVYTDKPVAHGNQFLATNVVGVQNFNTYLQGPTSEELLDKVNAEMPTMVYNSLQQAVNTGIGRSI